MQAPTETQVPNIPAARQVATLQRKLTHARARAQKAMAEADILVQALQGICDHSQTADYTWEHDNGFGRQNPHIGSRCRFCGWVDLWKRGKFTDPREID